MSPFANQNSRPAITTIAAVTRGGTRLIVALVAAVLAAMTLSACGDSDSETTTSSPTPSSSANGGGGGAADRQGPSGAQGGRAEAKGDDGDSQRSGGSEPAEVKTPLRVSGGGSEQFRVKGGDNSIQEYGDESDESELQAAAEAVHGFYVARAEGDWGRACSYLATSMVAQLKALAGQSPELKGAGCAAVLKAFTRQLPASVRRETTVVDAGSLRHDGERGFLIYYDSEDKPYAMPLEDEDGEWRLTLLSGTPLG
jgi:hypothetical protein